MAYIVKIQEVKTVIVGGQSYAKIGQEEKERSFKPGEYYLSDIMGWIDDPQKTEKIEREIYSQRVEEIDLPAVIKAINKL